MFERSCAFAIGHSGFEVVGRHPGVLCEEITGTTSTVLVEETTGAISMADDNKMGRKREGASTAVIYCLYVQCRAS